jgi:hypothetical protein
MQPDLETITSQQTTEIMSFIFEGFDSRNAAPPLLSHQSQLAL